MKDYFCRIFTDLSTISFEFSSDNIDYFISKTKDTYGNSVKRIVIYEIISDLVADVDF